MRISLGCDHGALALKNRVAEHLRGQGHEVVDFGTHTADSCDYPDFAAAAARVVASGECQRGIVLCTTGIGVSITANKVRGIRCALLSDLMSARPACTTIPTCWHWGPVWWVKCWRWRSWTPGWAPNFPTKHATSAASTR